MSFKQVRLQKKERKKEKNSHLFCGSLDLCPGLGYAWLLALPSVFYPVCSNMPSENVLCFCLCVGPVFLFMCPTLLFGFNARMTKDCNCFQSFILTCTSNLFFSCRHEGAAWPTSGRLGHVWSEGEIKESGSAAVWRCISRSCESEEWKKNKKERFILFHLCGLREI